MTNPRVKTYGYSRTYAPSTLGRLWGLSGNRCAHPDCQSKLIADSTPLDDSIIIGHIAHIYSVNSGGPRPYPFEDTSKEVINGHDNLLLLCRHHHALVDGQESSFPAELLKQWKLNHSRQLLATRASFLPERFRQFACMGTGFGLQSVDGTIASIGTPVSRLMHEKGVLIDRNVLYVDRQAWIRLDNGHEFELKLQNIDPPGREGTRVTLLEIIDGSGNRLPHSIFSHTSENWTQLNHTWGSIQWSISAPEGRLGVLLLFAIVFSIILLPPMLGLRQHDNAMLLCLGFMATSLIGAGIRHWRLWQHATRATQETQFV